MSHYSTRRPSTRRPSHADTLRAAWDLAERKVVRAKTAWVRDEAWIARLEAEANDAHAAYRAVVPA